MSPIAVDIVLLPEPSVVQWAIEINQVLVRNHASEIVLHAEHCLPHISLSMGCIDPCDIEDITHMLETLVQAHPLRQVQAAGIAMPTNAKGQTVSSLGIAKTLSLQGFHEDIMQQIQPFFRYDVTEDMLYGDEPIAHTTLAWIRDYPEKSGFSRFLPHITLGYGKVEACSYPQVIGISSLAICHLGNHCTCRRIIAQVRI
jgi:hypothetical protein